MNESLRIAIAVTLAERKARLEALKAEGITEYKYWNDVVPEATSALVDSGPMEEGGYRFEAEPVKRYIAPAQVESGEAKPFSVSYKFTSHKL